MKDKRYDKAKDAISIKQFLSQYLNVNSSCIKLRHCDLRELHSPLVVGVSNDYADKNPDLVKEGFLIIVLDCKHNRGTYVNPKYLMNMAISKGLREKITEIEKMRSKTFEDFKELFDKVNELTEELINLGRFENYESDLKELEIMGKTRALEQVEEYEKKWDIALTRIRKDDCYD